MQLGLGVVLHSCKLSDFGTQGIDLCTCLQDLNRALQLMSEPSERAEIQLELSVVLRRQRDYRRSVRACRAALEHDRANAQVRSFECAVRLAVLTKLTDPGLLSSAPVY